MTFVSATQKKIYWEIEVNDHQSYQQNISFCIPQNKIRHGGMNEHEDEKIIKVNNLDVNLSFNFQLNWV